MKFCLIVKKSELAKELKNSSYKLIDNGRKQRYTRGKPGCKHAEY